VTEFIARYRNASLLVGVVFLQLVLLGYQVRRGEEGRLLRVWTVGAMAPFQDLFSSGTDLLGSFWGDYIWLLDTRVENERLQTENAHLQLQKQQLMRALSRFSREEELLTYQNQISSQTILAQVIGTGYNPNAKEYFLDKGTRDGVRAGMPVITPDGIAGKIQASYSRYSLLLLINDQDSGVGVVLRDSQQHGVMKGTGTHECLLENADPDVEVRPGEAVFTSGDDRIYPRGFPVGEVARVGPGPENQEIYIRPFARLSRLKEVLVVTFGVHADLPRYPRPQPPDVLMPLPPPSAPVETTAAADDGADGSEEAPASTMEIPSEEAPSERHLTPLTDADSLRQRYQAIGQAQQHRFGEGKPGTPPPDFNLGMNAAPAPPGAPSQPDLKALQSDATRPPGESEARPETEARNETVRESTQAPLSTASP
jgi:rod shape-determining protein MreC